MSIESKVFQALSTKVELESNKYEFATIGSIVQYRDQIANDFLSAQGIASSSRNSLENKLGSTKVKINSQLSSIEEAKQQVKDLGIDNPKELLDAETSAKNYLKKVEDALKIVVKLDF